MKRLIILLAALSAAAVYAQQPLMLNPDAKSLGMGGVTTTTLGASHAIYNNPAMTLFSPNPAQISSSYFGQTDVNYYAVTGFWRFDTKNMALVGWRQLLRERGNSDMALDVSYARRLGERWGVGVAARYTHLRRPGGSTDDALSADLSVAYALPLENLGAYSTLRAGAKLTDLGAYFGDSAYTPPMSLKAGVALDTFITDAHEVTIGTDLGGYFRPGSVRGFQMSVGAEYNLMQLFQLRAGYHYGGREAYDPSYTSLGAGVRFLHLRLDFAYLFAREQTLLRNAYSISFGFDF